MKKCVFCPHSDKSLNLIANYLAILAGFIDVVKSAGRAGCSLSTAATLPANFLVLILLLPLAMMGVVRKVRRS